MDKLAVGTLITIDLQSFVGLQYLAVLLITVHVGFNGFNGNLGLIVFPNHLVLFLIPCALTSVFFLISVFMFLCQDFCLIATG